jgi:hypothetical protein
MYEQVYSDRAQRLASLVAGYVAQGMTDDRALAAAKRMDMQIMQAARELQKEKYYEHA